MTVKDVITKSIKLLNLDPAPVDYDVLVRCYNLVEQDLATGYFPILEVDKFFNVKDKIYLKDFSRKLYMIKGVQDFRGDSVKFKVTKATSEYVELKKNYEGGTFFVKYYYIPEVKTLDDTCTYSADYLDILIYGIAAEYYLTLSKIETALDFHLKQKDYIDIKKPKKKI
jgi:hypothetical protein